MVSTESPAVARRRVRLALRKAREASGLTQGQVAEELEWSLSKVNRIESGDVTVSNTDLKAMLELYGVTDEKTINRLAGDARNSRRRGWWDEPRYREHVTPPTMQMIQFESEASAIRVFQPTLIPGLLQTREYATAILDVWSDELSEADRETRLEVRLQRAGQVFDRPDPPKYLVIIDESVIQRQVGGPRVMAGQLEALLTRMASAYTQLRILPFSDAAALVQMASFTLLDLGDEEDAVLYREVLYQDDIVHSRPEIRRHRQRFDQIWKLSLTEDASTRLIRARLATLVASLDR
jgi:transcriptional regulator with XRE-family HTH domain